jgi:hypothetical protein
MPPEDPKTIGRYQILERVGRGGMGVLLRGNDPVLDREVAIKLMLLDFAEDIDQMRPRFYREARAAAKLQHPNIVTVFEFAEDGTTPYIVMEFLRGSSLQARMASPLPLTLDEKLNAIIQLCNALNYAHEQGVVHRDIKPANVFLLPDGNVKLLDFGIAKLATSTLTRQGDVLGSAQYMSPEQISGGGSIDGRSDIFSTGIVLYEVLAGCKPFQADSLTAMVVKLLREDPPSLDEVAPGLPPQLVAAVSRALAKDPADRYATAGELSRELQWIRQALQAADPTTLTFDETRLASQSQLLELHKTLEKDRLQAASPSTHVKGTTRALVDQTRNWLIPAIIGAGAIAVVVLAFLVGRWRPSPGDPVVDGGSAATGPAVTAPAATGPAATGPAATGPAATGPAAAPAGSIPAGGPVEPASKIGVPTAKPAELSLMIESVPAGAAIVIDGRATSQSTPAAINLSAGPHRLRLSRSGFVTQEIALSEADLGKGVVSVTLPMAEAVVVPVSIDSPYPVEVFSGSRSVSLVSESHRLKIAAGTTLRIAARQYLLNDSVRVTDRPVEYRAPALGFLTVLTNHETCEVKIGDQVLGFPPITKMPVAAGQYRVDLTCKEGQSPAGQLVTVPPNQVGTARIF